MKYYFFIIALTLLLVGCTAQPESVAPSNDNTQEKPAVVMDDTNMAEGVSALKGDVSIIISGSKITPSDITIPFDEETTIVFDNEKDTMQRIDIPMYQSEVSVDIAPGTYEVVMVHPKAKGLYHIEMNGASIGTIVVE